MLFLPLVRQYYPMKPDSKMRRRHRSIIFLTTGRIIAGRIAGVGKILLSP